jgi:pyridoxine 5-phosphate synthase
LKSSSLRLGVNIDHCATLRQVRGQTTPYPDLIQCAQWAKKGGADLITIHLREDRRHIQDQDVQDLCKGKRLLPINLELALNPKMIPLALKYQPDWVCFVPEKRQELTTEGGLDVISLKTQLKKVIPQLKEKGIRVSLFIAPCLRQVRASHSVGADAIELHTGHWVLYKGQKKDKEWKRLVSSAYLGSTLDLGIHGGHGLDYESASLAKDIPHLEELNIGHSLVCYSLEKGLTHAVKKMKQCLSTPKLRDF